MKKTFQLKPDGKHPDRVLEAVKHEIRKYLKRERRRELPAGADFLDFDCKLGAAESSAVDVHAGNLIESIDTIAKEGGVQCYVEILAKAGHRKVRPAEEASSDQARDQGDPT